MTTTNVVQLSSITPHPSVEYWSVCKVEALFETPFLELIYRAAQVHREHFNPGAIQLSTLMSIKTGGCPEDCGCNNPILHLLTLPPYHLATNQKYRTFLSRYLLPHE